MAKTDHSEFHFVSTGQKVPTPTYPTRETLIADGWC